MSKHALIVPFLFTVLACKIANGLVYSVKGLDGSAQKIKIADNEKSTLINFAFLTQDGVLRWRVDTFQG